MTEEFECVFLAFDTDGIDGNTTAAGAWVNHEVIEVIGLRVVGRGVTVGEVKGDGMRGDGMRGGGLRDGGI